MRNPLEVHVLQHFVPSLLNRDDTGSPKEALFGGYRRARVSSQSWKRAIREYVKENVAGIATGLRTKRLAGELSAQLLSRGCGESESLAVASAALGGLGLLVEPREDTDKPDEPPEYLTQYLAFIGRDEIERLAAAIHDHWAEWADVAAEVARKDEEARQRDPNKPIRGENRKAMYRALAPKARVTEIERCLEEGQAVDIALFGRMLADLPKHNVDGAVQVSHAISTNAVTREFDYYTAVDDIRPEDTLGADMIGTVEFNSACYYRYALVDLDRLMQNLHEDRTLTIQAAEAFLRAFVYAIPKAKQHSFGAQNLPRFVAFVLGRDAAPRNLAGAFENPVRAAEDSLSVRSLYALDREWGRLQAVYGGSYKLWTASVDQVSLQRLLSATAPDGQRLEDALDLVVAALEAQLQERGA